MRNLQDHGLPLVQLKERRRDLVVALQNRPGVISDQELMQIAALQQVITAVEEVIADFDAELIECHYGREPAGTTIFS